MAWHRAGTKEGSMTHLPLAALGLVSTLALAACTPSGLDMSTPASPSDAAARGQDGATYRPNPRPTQAYRITMTITHPPGPFPPLLAPAPYAAKRTATSRDRVWYYGFTSVVP